PTTRPPAWPGCAAKHTPGCSATAVPPARRADRRLESACETCAYFRTGTEFLPIPGPRCSTGSSSEPKPKGADHMPQITLEAGDAAEPPRCSPSCRLAARQPATGPRRELRRLRRPPGLHHQVLCADLHRFDFLLRASDGEELSGEPTP